MVAFDAWAELASVAPSLTAQDIGKGCALAVERRHLLKELIARDPRQAIASAVPLRVRDRLPREVTQELEVRVAGAGDLALIGQTPVSGSKLTGAATFHSARIAGVEFRAFVYGRRQDQATKVRIPLQGISLDGLLAVSESPLRVLEPGEVIPAAADLSRQCPVSGETLPPRNREEPPADPAATVAVGDRFVELCHVDHVALFEDRLIQSEDAAGPYPSSGIPVAANDAPGTSTVVGIPPLAWSTGPKKVLIIRVDFSDLVGTPVNSSDKIAITPAYVADVFNRADGIADFYQQASYSKTSLSLTASDVTAVCRLPRTASYYAVGDGFNAYNNTLHDDARAAAAAKGVKLENYDRIGVVFSFLGNLPGSNITYGGLGQVQGKYFWVNSFLDFRITAHEIGHTYGLQHSNLWKVYDGNPVSSNGFSEEYEDPFSVMSSATTTIRCHFDMWQKSILHWLPDSSVATISTSGRYRVYRFDHHDADLSRPLALKIVRNSTQDYWIGLRELWPENAAMTNGAYVLWGYNRVVQGNLIDFGTAGDDPRDAPLPVGASFYDSEAGITLTPLSRSGTSPNEYLDIQVNFGPPGTSSLSGVAISGPASAAAGKTCLFTAQLAGGVSDPVVYSWDFGNGAITDNAPEVAYSWPVGGSQQVKLTVSDMKGHSVSAILDVDVSDPLQVWKSRTTYAGGRLTALATNGQQVLAVGEDYDEEVGYHGAAIFSSNGVTWSSGNLGINYEGYGATWFGSKWVVVGMTYGFDVVPGWYGTVLTSSNSQAWTRSYLGGGILRSVATDGAKALVAVGDRGVILRSTDAVTWTQVGSTAGINLGSVSYGDGTFVTVGYKTGTGGPVVKTSPDGLTWTDYSNGAGTGSYRDLRSIAWCGDRFLASGYYGKLRYSSDQGRSFVTTREQTEQTPALAYGNGVWFAAGEDLSSGSASVDLISLDGKNWSKLSNPVVEKRNAAIFFKNTFITVGDNHSIRQSESVASIKTGYLLWREKVFPGLDSTSYLGGDPDGDGVSNFMEYALGRSPTIGSGNDGVASLPRALSGSTDALLRDRLTLSFSLPEPIPPDVVYVVEAADDPAGPFTPVASKKGAAAWEWLGSGTTHVKVALSSGGRVQTSVGDSQPQIAAQRRFLRLRALFTE